MSFTDMFMNEVVDIATRIDKNKVENIVERLKEVREDGGRVFILGIGGSAGNAGHMVNDLRKLCGIEAYAPTDNVSEFSARTNDEGFDTVFTGYLEVSKLNAEDAIFILSVGGGSEERNVSMGLVKAVQHAKSVGAYVLGIVGKPDGYTALNGDEVVVVPIASSDRITPHSEAFQAVVWHSVVSNPNLQERATKW